MRSSILSFVGLTCLFGSLSLSAVGQQQVPPPAGQQASLKEIKFKLEWITTSGRVPGSSPNATPASPDTETISLITMDGDTAMTANKVVGTDTYRRITLHPESQKDGSTIVDVSVSEFSKDSERDTPRLSTRIRLKGADVRVIQARTAKGTNFDYEYLLNISME
jgi:hypothetical protein